MARATRAMVIARKAVMASGIDNDHNVLFSKED
jgi:hypothetical protein